MSKDFEPIQSPNRLGWFIGIPIKVIEEITTSTDTYYKKEWERKKLNGDGSPKIKKGKIETRTINESLGKLKKIQDRINKRILQKIPLPDCVLGGVSPYSNIDNAKYHKGKKYHFQTDILDFFPSINNKRVYQTLVDLGFSPDVSHLITRLTTYKGKLPQGTPTSTSIANIVLSPMDMEISQICNEERITYTRWVDDLNFSSSTDFSKIVPLINNIIQENGFRIKHRKTRYKIGPIKVTGVLTKNNTLLVPDEKYRRLKDINLSESSREGLVRYIRNVQGKI